MGSPRSNSKSAWSMDESDHSPKQKSGRRFSLLSPRFSGNRVLELSPKQKRKMFAKSNSLKRQNEECNIEVDIPTQDDGLLGVPEDNRERRLSEGEPEVRKVNLCDLDTPVSTPSKVKHKQEEDAVSIRSGKSENSLKPDLNQPGKRWRKTMRVMKFLLAPKVKQRDKNMKTYTQEEEKTNSTNTETQADMDASPDNLATFPNVASVASLGLLSVDASEELDQQEEDDLDSGSWSSGSTWATSQESGDEREQMKNPLHQGNENTDRDKHLMDKNGDGGKAVDECIQSEPSSSNKDLNSDHGNGKDGHDTIEEQVEDGEPENNDLENESKLKRKAGKKWKKSLSVIRFFTRSKNKAKNKSDEREQTESDDKMEEAEKAKDQQILENFNKNDKSEIKPDMSKDDELPDLEDKKSFLSQEAEKNVSDKDKSPPGCSINIPPLEIQISDQDDYSYSSVSFESTDQDSVGSDQNNYKDKEGESSLNQSQVERSPSLSDKHNHMNNPSLNHSINSTVGGNSEVEINKTEVSGCLEMSDNTTSHEESTNIKKRSKRHLSIATLVARSVTRWKKNRKRKPEGEKSQNVSDEEGVQEYNMSHDESHCEKELHELDTPGEDYHSKLKQADSGIVIGTTEKDSPDTINMPSNKSENSDTGSVLNNMIKEGTGVRNSLTDSGISSKSGVTVIRNKTKCTTTSTSLVTQELSSDFTSIEISSSHAGRYGFKENLNLDGSYNSANSESINENSSTGSDFNCERGNSKEDCNVKNLDAASAQTSKLTSEGCQNSTNQGSRSNSPRGKEEIENKSNRKGSNASDILKNKKEKKNLDKKKSMNNKVVTKAVSRWLGKWRNPSLDPDVGSASKEPCVTMTSQESGDVTSQEGAATTSHGTVDVGGGRDTDCGNPGMVEGSTGVGHQEADINDICTSCGKRRGSDGQRSEQELRYKNIYQLTPITIIIC